MKLTLIAHASKPDWIIIEEFFLQDPRFRVLDNFIITNPTSSRVSILINEEGDFRFSLYQPPKGLLVSELYEILKELADQVKAGDFSKLPELADTWLCFDELLKKEN